MFEVRIRRQMDIYPSAEPALIWHEMIGLPSELLSIFRDPALYDVLCSYCRRAANLVYNDTAFSRAFCDSCRIKLGQIPSFKCQGGCDTCVEIRFIDPIGHVAPLCRECHKRSASDSNDLKKSGAISWATVAGRPSRPRKCRPNNTCG